MTHWLANNLPPFVTGVAASLFVSVATPSLGLWRHLAANGLLVVAIGSVGAWQSVRKWSL